MSRMKDLFGDTPYLPRTAPQNWRATGPHTSKDAGIVADQRFRSDHLRKIYTVLKQAASPMSAEQIASHLGWVNHVPVNRRLSELERAGLIKVVDSNYRNRSGRSAQRYVVRG